MYFTGVLLTNKNVLFISEIWKRLFFALSLPVFKQVKDFQVCFEFHFKAEVSSQFHFRKAPLHQQKWMRSTHEGSEPDPAVI